MKRAVLFVENIPFIGEKLPQRMEELYKVYQFDCTTINIPTFIGYLLTFSKEDKEKSIIYLKNIQNLPIEFDKVVIHLIEYDNFNVVAMAAKDSDNLAVSLKPIPLHLKSRFIVVNEINLVLKILEHQIKK